MHRHPRVAPHHPLHVAQGSVEGDTGGVEHPHRVAGGSGHRVVLAPGRAGRSRGQPPRGGDRVSRVERLREQRAGVQSVGHRERAQQLAPQRRAPGREVVASIPVFQHVGHASEVGGVALDHHPARGPAAVDHRVDQQLGTEALVGEQRGDQVVAGDLAAGGQPLGQGQVLARAQGSGCALQAVEGRVALERLGRGGEPVRVVGVHQHVAPLDLGQRAERLEPGRPGVGMVEPLVVGLAAVEQGHPVLVEQGRDQIVADAGHEALLGAGAQTRRGRCVDVPRPARSVGRQGVHPRDPLHPRVHLLEAVEVGGLTHAHELLDHGGVGEVGVAVAVGGVDPPPHQGQVEHGPVVRVPQRA